MEQYQSILEQYTIIRELEYDLDSIVYLAQSKKTLEDVSIKIIDRTKINKKQQARIEKELQLLEQLNHPNIIRLIDTKESDTHIIIVTEALLGGCLIDKILELDHFGENEVSEVMLVLLDVVRYCQVNGIVHGNITVFLKAPKHSL